LAKRLAHDEWLRISERYTRMQRELRTQGSLVGRNPFGYRIVPDGSRNTLEPEPTEAQVIRDAANWYLAGATLDVLCERLNDAGRLPRPRKDGRQARWVPKTISGVLRNEVVAGRQKDAHGRTILKVPPILPRKTWEAVIARMDQRANHKGISQSKTAALLTSIIACSKSDQNLYRTGSSCYRGYYCRQCGGYVRLELADQLIHDALATDQGHDVVEVVIAGRAHEDEIAEVKRDMAEAVDAEDFERLTVLRAELDRLRSLPAEPPRVERRLSDQTVAQMWAALPDDAARRDYLLHRHVRALYEDGLLSVNLGSLNRPR
jgi:Recombinase